MDPRLRGGFKNENFCPINYRYHRRAIAFLRVSSYRQKDNTSHETQLRAIEEYCSQCKLELVRTEPIVESAKASEQRIEYARTRTRALDEGIQHFVFYMYV